MLQVSRVRKATAADEPDLMHLCRELQSENALMPMNQDRVLQYLRRAFNSEGAICGVIGDVGRIEGAIYLVIGNFWYSDQWHLEEFFNFVRPQYRRSNNAKDLIGFAKRCSDEIGIPLVIGIISNERTEAKVRLYERQLAKPSGAFFVHNPLATQASSTHVQRAAG